MKFSMKMSYHNQKASFHHANQSHEVSKCNKQESCRDFLYLIYFYSHPGNISHSVILPFQNVLNALNVLFSQSQNIYSSVLTAGVTTFPSSSNLLHNIVTYHIK